MPAAIPITARNRAEMIKRYGRGETLIGIGEAIGISHPIVARVLRENGVVIRTQGPRVLTPAQETQIPTLYDEGQTIKAIAQRYDCSLEPIKRILGDAERLGTLRRPRHGRKKLTTREKTDLIRLYEQGLSRYALSQKFQTNPQAILRVLSEAKVKLRDDRTRRGTESPLFRGGRHINAEGYVRVLVPDDSPFVSMRSDRRMASEHRLVMAEHLGRPLFPYERVHHRNGIREDNRIENLELWEETHPPGQRAGEATHLHCPTCSCYRARR